MIKKLLFLFIFAPLSTFCQEMESDLFLHLNNSTLHLFKSSEKSKMVVLTFRNSKEHGTVQETKTTYRKGKISPEKINFTTAYSEYYLLENRKKSLGRYIFNEKNQIRRYERTDFDNRNQRTYGYYHNYRYIDNVLQWEFIRTREYVSQGSVEQDSIIYLDSVVYNLKKLDDGIKQINLTDEGAYSKYVIKDKRLASKSNFFPGFNENVSFSYNSKGQLVGLTNELTNDEAKKEGKSIITSTEITYNMEGLVTEVYFYDSKGEILERKVYSYK